MGSQIKGVGRGKLTFPKLIKDPVCHGAAILKGPFLNFFLSNKSKKSVFDPERILLVT